MVQEIGQRTSKRNEKKKHSTTNAGSFQPKKSKTWGVEKITLKNRGFPRGWWGGHRGERAVRRRGEAFGGKVRQGEEGGCRKRGDPPWGGLFAVLGRIRKGPRGN